MNTKFLPQLIKLIATAALVMVPHTSNAIPITYNIGAGGGDGFSGSYLHSASWSGSGGYYMNGYKASMTGTLTYDLVTGNASGSITGSRNNTYTLNWKGVSRGSHTFYDNDTDLLSLNYELLKNGGFHSIGIFYFVDKEDFAGAANSISDDNLFLWGNNWINKSGNVDSRDNFNGTPLGLDLYGVRADAPAPGIAMVMLIGLLGIGASSRLKAA